MARSFTKPSQHIPPYLSQTQQDLLLAALNSQAIDSANSQRAADSDDTPGPAMSGLNGNGMFISPQKADLDNFDYTPELDYLDGNDFDFENADLGGEMIGALPGGAQKESHGDGHEKRKSPDENVDAPEGDAKRQETGEGEKSAKKPGRKPLTTEPTTVSCALCLAVDVVSYLTLNCRSEKRKTELRSGLSVSAKKLT